MLILFGTFGLIYTIDKCSLESGEKAPTDSYDRKIVEKFVLEHALTLDAIFVLA